MGSRASRDRTSVSQEDYLKAIWEMGEEEQVPISARLSEELGVTPPAVTAALKRMERNGYVKLGPRGRIELTRKGSELAEHLMLRHNLAEKLLVEVLGMPWTRVHDEAEKLEHAISPELERLLLNYFGRESYCPHGNPLDGGLTKLRRLRDVQPLSAVRAGKRVEVVRVYEKDTRFLDYLDRLKLRPGTRLLVEHRDYDESVQAVVAGRTVHLGRDAAEKIWVKELRGRGLLK
ncbi:MAG TPA: metal-dependent transcriptional regulator [Candidatus Xenobia bacterium]|nr:metal-dependent transcriptional regulator [Candidatus Xenobia bacterium]